MIAINNLFFIFFKFGRKKFIFYKNFINKNKKYSIKFIRICLKFN